MPTFSVSVPGGSINKLSLEQRIQRELMAQNYESSKVTITPKPSFSYYTRIETFLIHPAKGRSAQQLADDYERLAENTKQHPVFHRRLQIAYAIGQARSNPNQVVEWAQRNINGFSSQRAIRNQLFRTWDAHDPVRVSQWVKDHPELGVTLTSSIKSPFVHFIDRGQQQIPTITLPR